MSPDEISLLVYTVQGAIATVALAPVLAALRPHRHMAAARQVNTAPLRCLVAGLLPVSALLTALVVLAISQRHVGYAALLILGGLTCGLSVGVCGHAIANRLLDDDAGLLRRVLIGTALICGSVLWPAAGLAILVIAMVIGTGGWITARRGDP